MNKIKFNRPAHRNNLTNVLDDFFNVNFGSHFESDSRKTPPINILESDSAFIIELAAPGLTKENFSINVEKDQLIISSKKSEDKNEKDTLKFKRREFNYSEFKKSFHLNKDINLTKIDAKYDNGVLTVSLEKKEEAKEQEPRVIAVG